MSLGASEVHFEAQLLLRRHIAGALLKSLQHPPQPAVRRHRAPALLKSLQQRRQAVQGLHTHFLLISKQPVGMFPENSKGVECQQASGLWATFLCMPSMTCSSMRQAGQTRPTSTNPSSSRAPMPVHDCSHCATQSLFKQRGELH